MSDTELDASLRAAVATVPPGAWAVGVSGGADSVALILLLATRSDLRLHAAHLDHQTRGQESTADAQFVEHLCGQLNIQCTVNLRDHIERQVHPQSLPGNLSARFRALRMELFRQVCQQRGLAGVILAHHANDQAETTFQRLLKGSAPAGLMGMTADSVVRGLRIVRPLLAVHTAELRVWLTARGQPWREDSSNTSPAYQRNRARAVLRQQQSLAGALREMSTAMRELVTWARDAAPVLEVSFMPTKLADLPDVLATESARQWLVARGCPPDELSPSVIDRLVEMVRDAATPARQNFPGGILVRRRGGRITAESPITSSSDET